MGIERVSTFNIFQTTLGAAGRLQGNLATLQQQVSSGRKSQDFAGIAGEAMQYMQLEDKLLRIDRYLANNQLAKVRLDSTNTALSQVIETATQLKTLISQRRSHPGADTSFSTQMTDLWQTLAAQLNITVGGRYLFSGAAIDTAPVDTENFPQLAEPGVPDDGYYLGSNQDMTVRPDDNIEFVYNVRANAQGFQDIFAGLTMAREGDLLAAGDPQAADAMLAQAFDLVTQGVQDVITLQARVNTHTVTITSVNENLTALKIYWQGISEDLINTDIIAASTQIAINEAILQASFQSFARITSLRLADFLR